MTPACLATPVGPYGVGQSLTSFKVKYAIHDSVVARVRLPIYGDVYTAIKGTLLWKAL